MGEIRQETKFSDSRNYRAMEKASRWPFGELSVLRKVIAENSPGMLILVAIDAEVFPVAAVGRVVGRIPVFVMDGQKVKVGSIELAGALGANPSMTL
jgi:hypothetical protein